MTRSVIAAAVEAVLFVAEKPVSRSELAKTIGAGGKAVGEALAELDRLRLSSAALETLAVVAYRQPVTRAEVESIRGVNCDQTIYTLMSRRLIEELGRREAPGSPFEYGTTWEFLECFGLTSLDALPTVLSPEGLRADGVVVADQ